MTASISGALIDYVAPAHPAWIPHRTVTHAEAIAALAQHLKRDCISTGPVFHSNRISGNFFLASAGFVIEDATHEEAQQVSSLLRMYEASAHADLYRRLQIIYAAQKAAEELAVEQAWKAGGDYRRRDAARNMVASQFRAQCAPLEHQLETIYRHGAVHA